MYNPYGHLKVREILKLNKIAPLKFLGQNFLVDKNICDKISNFSYNFFNNNEENKSEANGKFENLEVKKMVVEIGPGLGALTLSLLKNYEFVRAIEIDRSFIKILNENLVKKNIEKLIVYESDVLEFNFFDFLNKNSQFKINVCANLPYYISSQILINLFNISFDIKNQQKIENITVMLQKEFVQKLTFPPGDRNVSSFSVISYFFTENIKKILDVSKKSFFPEPKIDSSVINFKLTNSNLLKVKNKDFLFKLIKVLFSHRRKVIINNLLDGFSISKADLLKILDKSGLLPNLRVENLKLEDFLNLSNVLFDYFF